MCRRASIYVMYTVSRRTMSAMVVQQKQIIYIQFQLLLFHFRFVLIFSISSVSVIFIVNGIKFYPLMDWIVSVSTMPIQWYCRVILEKKPILQCCPYKCLCVFRYLVVALTFRAWSRVRLTKTHTSGWRVTLHLGWGFWNLRLFTRRSSQHCTELRAKWAAATSRRPSIWLTLRSRSRQKLTSQYFDLLHFLFNRPGF